jgi:ribosome-associated protein
MNELVRANADAIAQFLQDHRCSDVSVLDVTGQCSFADCFIIATINSAAHLRGVAHELWGELSALGVQVANRHKKPDSEGWELIDGGDIIIHLMSSEMREFYALEKLWEILEV